MAKVIMYIDIGKKFVIGHVYDMFSSTTTVNSLIIVFTATMISKFSPGLFKKAL